MSRVPAARVSVFVPFVWAAAWLAVAIVPLVAGLSNYALPLTERPFSELHDVFKPAGSAGHLLGVIGTLMMVVGVTSYSVRKRVRALSRLGSLRSWLSFHIFLCTLGPFLILLHTSFRFGGIVSIAFWSMTAIVASGVFGRYLYVRLPKGEPYRRLFKYWHAFHMPLALLMLVIVLLHVAVAVAFGYAWVHG